MARLGISFIADRKEEEESAHDSIDRAKKGEAAIPDELEAKPIDASESRDEGKT